MTKIKPINKHSTFTPWGWSFSRDKAGDIAWGLKKSNPSKEFSVVKSNGGAFNYGERRWKR